MHSQHYLQDDSTASLQTSVWWPTSTSASLSLSCCTSPKTTTLSTILAYISNRPFQMVTLLSVFSVACNLDSEKSSATGHNLPVLLLLSRHWVLAVAVLLPHLMKNSVPIHRKNIQATQVKCSRNDNCDKLESRKPISKQRKRQKAPGFQRFCLSVAVPDKRRNQNEPKAILQTFLFINCCKTISCYFMLCHQRAPYSPLQPPTSTEDWLLRFSSSCRCCSAAVVAEACCASHATAAVLKMRYFHKPF